MAPWRVALLLVAVAAPAALAPWGWELAAGIAASAALLVWSLRCAPQSAEPSAAGAAARPNAGALAPAGADANVSAAGTART
jgi:hypothetical protein